MGDGVPSLPHSQLQKIVSTMAYATEADTPEAVLKRIADASRELIGARYAALGVPGDAATGMRYFEVSGMSSAEIATMPHLPRGLGLLGAILEARQPVVVNNIAQDPRSVGFPAGHPPMTSLLGVPIQIGTQLLGMLYLTDKKDGQPFNHDDIWLAETMARYAALAISGSQFRESQRRLTLLEERQRIGMELHDGVIQSLYALGMHLDLARNTGKVSPDELGTIIHGLNTIIEDIRTYIMGLKVMGQEKTIRQALQEVVSRLYVPETLGVMIDAPDNLPPFAPSDFESICSIAREALSNAVRHAYAEQAGVRVWQDSSRFQMMIWDDGHGFDPDAITGDTGLGLWNIQERVRLHGGELHIDSTPGQGTTVTISIPTNGCHQPVE